MIEIVLIILMVIFICIKNDVALRITSVIYVVTRLLYIIVNLAQSIG